MRALSVAMLGSPLTTALSRGKKRNSARYGMVPIGGTTMIDAGRQTQNPPKKKQYEAVSYYSMYEETQSTVIILPSASNQPPGIHSDNVDRHGSIG